MHKASVYGSENFLSDFKGDVHKWIGDAELFVFNLEKRYPRPAGDCGRLKAGGSFSTSHGERGLKDFPQFSAAESVMSESALHCACFLVCERGTVELCLLPIVAADGVKIEKAFHGWRVVGDLKRFGRNFRFHYTAVWVSPRLTVTAKINTAERAYSHAVLVTAEAFPQCPRFLIGEIAGVCGLVNRPLEREPAFPRFLFRLGERSGATCASLLWCFSL